MADLYIFDEDTSDLLNQAECLLSAIVLITKQQNESQAIALAGRDVTIVNFLAREAIGRLDHFDSKVSRAAAQSGSAGRG